MNDIAKNIESTPAPPPGLSEKKIRLAFIHAPDPIYSSNQDYGAKFMPTWVYALASHIPDIGRFSLRLHDMRFEKEADIAEADLFLFSGINQDNGILNRLRESVKRRFPRSRSFVGGPICWSFDQAGTLDQIDAFDHICIGDGEEMIAEIVESACQGRALPHIIRAAGRFDLSRAVPLHRELLESTISRYYGAVVEVSRGCPFLCEFCDIRVLPDNNRSHVKDPDLIVEELDFLSRQGVRQFLFACDNFIGNPQWAEELVDKILAWEERTGFRANLYTWLTINLFRTPGLMKKMRRAGFDMLFIGVESFDANSLLETAKVQNTAQELVEALRLIQSYGFIVVGGLIFGFDSDGENFAETTIKGLLDSALLGGDPSWLTALPGTPLHRRMRLSGRLRDVRFGLGGFKYQTNIRYLLPREVLFSNFDRFIRTFSSGPYQYSRLKAFLDLLETGNFIPTRSAGFGSLRLFLKMLIGNPRAVWMMISRLRWFLAHPVSFFHAFRGLALVLSRRRIKGRFRYFQFWVFGWTNATLKYGNLSAGDWDIESVPADYDIRDILPKDYGTTAAEKIPRQKIAAQVRTTTEQLKLVIGRRAENSAPRPPGRG